MKKRNFILTLVIVFIFCGFLVFNFFSAKPLKKQELANLYLNITVYDTAHNKVYLTNSSNISISSKDSIIPFSVKNGSVQSVIPLYEYDSPLSSNTEKYISIDGNTHSTILNSSTQLPVSNASNLIQAFKNGDDLKISLDDYFITLDEKYNGYTIEWSLSRDLDQTYVNDDYNLHLVVKTENNYIKPSIPSMTGADNITDFTLPCEYNEVNVLTSEEGQYLRFLPISNEIYSIADGIVIETNDIENYIIVAYNTGIALKYDNVVLTNFNSEVKKGDILGYSNELNLYCIDNDKYIAAEWLYDGFERPTEGKSLPRMYQTDSRWKDIPYGYNTIGGGGCGPTSFAMVVSGLTGRTQTPEDIVNVISSLGDGIWYYKQGEGSYYTIFPKLANYYGLNIDDNISTSEESLKSYLNNGKILIVSLSHGNIYTGEGHFIVIRGLTEDGKFLINDSAKYFDLNTGYSYEDLLPIRSARAIYN